MDDDDARVEIPTGLEDLEDAGSDDRDVTSEPELRTWEDAEARTREFEALLERYDGDFQAATDAQLRGERPDPVERPGSANPI